MDGTLPSHASPMKDVALCLFRLGCRPAYRLVMLVAIAVSAVLVMLAIDEMKTSRWQARYLAEFARDLRFSVAPGPSLAIRFPEAGPYDQRLGYTDLPAHLDRLAARGFRIEEQVRLSPRLADWIDRGFNAPYREKNQAGLSILDCDGRSLLADRYPERVYAHFDAIPPVLVDTLLFIENRALLDSEHPRRNPALEWSRLAKAIVDQAIRLVHTDHDTSGGSTLATQIEKYRHSPQGRTASMREKFLQMASASVRAYQTGEDTTSARRQLVVDYLNTVPLAARAGLGEINGLGDGLWAWYGRDFDEMNRLLRADALGTRERKGLAYKETLSLMIAQRRPSHFLNGDLAELKALTNSYLRILASAGTIPGDLRDAALEQPLVLRASSASTSPAPYVPRKATTAVRSALATHLGVSNPYALDRLDLTVSSTLSAATQGTVSEVLHRLRDPVAARQAGLVGPQLLDRGDPAQVIYSFTLYEKGAGVNRLRVQTDNFDQPFDVNDGTKLDLGSTAKLRTLIHYLEIIASLHQRFADLNPIERRAVKVASQDAISRWAIDYLHAAKDRSLMAMLEAALARKYSASPGEEFYTGGGLHTFANFDSADDSTVLTIQEGFRRSVNLVFVRLMRDIVRYHMFNMAGSSARLLDDASDPARRAQLERFAEHEGAEFVRRFYRKHLGKATKESMELLAQSGRRTPIRLAAIFRSIEPHAGLEAFAAFVRSQLHGSPIDSRAIDKLYQEHVPGRFDLTDRGYLAGVHPLELWVVAFLRQQPSARLSQAIEVSAEERRAVYEWLYQSRRKHAQDVRIKTLLEMEAFLEIHKAWKRLGYPFGALVPSYATSLGVSADRPSALAELIGILLHDGVRVPSVRVEALHFAQGTPYETRLVKQSSQGERVLPVEVASMTRRLLTEVVEEGTARRLKGVFKSPEGKPIVVGGKTGTGDHRFETYGKGGALLSSRVVSR